MVACEEPYIGDESIMPPPSSRNAAITLVERSSSTESEPTLNVIQLPIPTAGMSTPDVGIRRRPSATFDRPARGGQARPQPRSLPLL